MNKFKFFYAITLLIFASGCVKDYDKPEPKEAKVEIRQDQIPNFEFLTPCEASNITFFINPNCQGTPYAVAILAAIQEYNDAPLTINFNQVFSEPADIIFNCVPGQNCGSGFTNVPPSNQTIGSTINMIINPTNCPCTTNPCMFMRSVMHEIGHALGLEHNGEGIHIPGTPNTVNDPNSIFNEGNVTLNDGQWCTAPCVFNQNDLIALEHFYGCPDVTNVINGPNQLCVNEIGRYCVNSDFCTVVWHGHPSINNITSDCVDISYNTPGLRFIYADVVNLCSGVTQYLQFNIQVGPPNIMANLTVEFDPCLSIIKIKANDPNPTASYSWGNFTGLNNNPHVSITGPGNQNATLKVLYGAGQTLCFTVSATSDCGTSSLPCQVCYTTPGCRGEGFPVKLKPSNSCVNGQCPPGFECKEGICCPQSTSGICVDNSQCPAGFRCVNGDCCHIQTGVCL